MKGLYIHIPFCESICHYCDFVKRIPKDSHMMDDYLITLKEELLTYRHHFDSIDTIYIGGGTPSMLNMDQLTFLFEMLKGIHPIEYTIEVNPESYAKEKGELFKKYGINRVSLGVQTFQNHLLTYLNRKHTKEHIYDVVHHLKEIGIKHISVDLIYAIPNQTLHELYDDLHHIDMLDITHVSCYSLILEEKTYFYHQYIKGIFKEMDEDTEATMYKIVMDELKKQGFEHYEISNFAKHKHYSHHNLLYWTLQEYIGIGLGAHGFVDGYRTYNESTLPAYRKNFQKAKDFQSKETLLQDELIFGLRKIEGVHMKDLENRYAIKLFDKYPNLKEKIEIGLIEINQGRLKLTEQGLFLGNQVFMVFI